MKCSSTINNSASLPNRLTFTHDDSWQYNTDDSNKKEFQHNSVIGSSAETKICSLTAGLLQESEVRNLPLMAADLQV